MKLKYILFFFILNLFWISFAQERTIYVSTEGEKINSGTKESPLPDIQSALSLAKKLRNKDKKTKILIHISSGIYRLKTPIKIDSQLNNIKIIGEGSDKVTIKGSQPISVKWKKHKGSILVTKISGNTHFDQIFINNKAQILARYPNYDENTGHWQGYAADAISQERVRSWKNPKGAIVHAMHSGEWGDFHYVISDVKKNGEVTLAGGNQNNRPSKLHDTYRMVENVFEELDSPGEWFFDKPNNLLYYWPTNDMNMENSLVEGVFLKNLIEIKGSIHNPVKEISIKGIRFEHSQRTFMEEYEPLLRSDWKMYRGGAVFLENTENIQILDCEFTNLGGNVIFVSKYNRNVRIAGNHIHDCGASGISFVGDPGAVRSPSFQYREYIPLDKMDKVSGPLNNNYPAESIADNNLIYRTGRIEKQTAGVQISMAMDITVSHNSIYDVPRAGINISDGTWGGHIIAYNDVFNTVLETSDHGSFNSWGRDRFWHPKRFVLDKMVAENPEMPKWDAIHTTTIRNNRFRCDHGWDIDLDDGSSNYHVYNNLCLNGGIKLREGFYRTVENNIMVNNSFHPHVWFAQSEDIFIRNIVMTKYRDVQVKQWGKEVDYNLFPDKEALEFAQSKDIDTHSKYGNPLFIAPEKGNFIVSKESPALTLGFKNFSMNDFGVQDPILKAIAKTPEIPPVWSISIGNNKEDIKEFKWLGARLKNIETLAERSAFGLNKTAGVLIQGIDKNSILKSSGLQTGDVIISGEGQKINTIEDLLKIYQGSNWKGKLNMDIFRNQKKQTLLVLTKKK